jgi:hypothetical protein
MPAWRRISTRPKTGYRLDTLAEQRVGGVTSFARFYTSAGRRTQNIQPAERTRSGLSSPAPSRSNPLPKRSRAPRRMTRWSSPPGTVENSSLFKAVPELITAATTPLAHLTPDQRFHPFNGCASGKWRGSARLAQPMVETLSGWRWLISKRADLLREDTMEICCAPNAPGAT